MKKKICRVVFLIFILVFFSSCEPIEVDEDAFTIGVSYDSDGAFPSKWISALKESCKEENVNVIAISSQYSPEKQISDIELLITQRVDVIVVRPNSTGSIISALEFIHQAGVPCILIDFPVDEQYEYLYDVFISENMYEEGKLQAEFVKKWAEEDPSREINIGYLSGPYENQSSLLKRDSFYAEMGITEPQAESDCDWSVTNAFSTVELWLKTNPEINVIACMNDDMAAGAVQALSSANKNMEDYLVLGMDGNPNYKDFFISGDIDCTVVRDLKEESKLIISIARGLANGREYEKSIYPDSAFIVTKENAEEYFGEKGDI